MRIKGKTLPFKLTMVINPFLVPSARIFSSYGDAFNTLIVPRFNTKLSSKILYVLDRKQYLTNAFRSMDKTWPDFVIHIAPPNSESFPPPVLVPFI